MYVDQCTRDLTEHFARAAENPASLLMHAYAMVTRIEFEYGDRLADASRALRVTQAALRRLRRLSTERSVGCQARKYEGKVKRTAIATEEVKWVQTLLRQLVDRSWNVALKRNPGPQLTAENVLPPNSAAKVGRWQK